MDKKTFLRLSFVFAIVYFFSSNGLGVFPGITVNFLLKNELQMTATQAAYFGAITSFGWAIKPLWGMISDAFPLFGTRRKSYLILMSILTTIVWSILALIPEYNVLSLIVFFILSSLFYSFADVVTDALMVQEGKAHNLTGRFQAIQWTSVYVAGAIAGLAGGWAAQNLTSHQVFGINAIFPLIIAIAAFFLVKEGKVVPMDSSVRGRLKGTLKAFTSKYLWFLAFFQFFVAFSPSYGTPFFYYAVDTLKFNPIFFGTIAMIGAIFSAIGAILYGIFAKKLRTKGFLVAVLIASTIFTLFGLVYFIPQVVNNIVLAQWIYIANTAVVAVLGTIAFLIILDLAAVSAPVLAEGASFAVSTTFWNIGSMGAAVIGGYLFSKIGLEPLIVVSAAFTLAALVFVPYLNFDVESPEVRTDQIVDGVKIV